MLRRAVPEAKQDEDAQRFQRRVREEGPALFQSAMWRVHGTMEQMQCWLSWTAVQQKLAMRVRMLVVWSRLFVVIC